MCSALERHRLLLSRRGSKPTNSTAYLKIADLTVDETYAAEFIKEFPIVTWYHKSSWKDLKIGIYI